MKFSYLVAILFITLSHTSVSKALPIPRPTPSEGEVHDTDDLVYHPEGEPTPPPELWQKAEEPNLAEGGDITTEQVAALIASKFGIPAQSKITERFHDLIVNYKKGTKIGREKAKIKVKPGIYKHYRFGKGVLFPSEDELKPIAPTPEERKAILEGIVEAQRKLKSNLQKRKAPSKTQEHRSNQFMKLATPRTLPVCSEDRTVTIKNSDNHPLIIDEDIDSSEVLFDVLFLQESAPQMKNLLTGPEELFGLSTQVEYYSQMPGMTSSFVASENDVECLPFRLRVTKSVVERRYGEDALERFNPETEKWEIHPNVQRKLKEFF